MYDDVLDESCCNDATRDIKTGEFSKAFCFWHPVRPSSFTLEATPMPVEVNANISATCVVYEIRPEPMEFYWMLGDMRMEGVSNSTVVNSTYNITNVEKSIRLDAVGGIDGKTLMCVLVMGPCEEELRSLQIDIVVVGMPGGEGVYVFSIFWQDPIIRLRVRFMCKIELIWMNATSNK